MHPHLLLLKSSMVISQQHFIDVGVVVVVIIANVVGAEIFLEPRGHLEVILVATIHTKKSHLKSFKMSNCRP